MRSKNKKSILHRGSFVEDAKKLSLNEKIFATPFFFSEAGLKPSFFTNKDLSNLSSTSPLHHLVVQTELTARKLLQHVVLGEQTKACVMIKANPELLLVKSRAVDYSGRTIIATPFQAAIGAGDKPMWEMMLPYFEPGEALRQFHEWFPNGIADTPASELQAYYTKIARAIATDANHGQLVIEGFRKEITRHKVITQGTHFNLQHLLAAHQAYIANFDVLGNEANLDLFWKQVIAYVQRQMTTYDAQIHCSGIQNVLESETDFSREIRIATGQQFFPLCEGSGLGYDFGCYSYYSIRASFKACTTYAMLPRACVVEQLCKMKNDALARLGKSLEQEMGCQLK